MRSGNTGDFLTTSQQYQVDSGSTYYYFLIGVLHSEQNNVRGISLTYGQTAINGKFITTGRIQSVDGINFFDLDTGQFFIGDANSSLDWNVTNSNKLTIKGSLIQTPAGDSVTLPNYKGPYSPVADYYSGDLVTFNGKSYANKTAAATIGILPTATTHWDIFSETGAIGPTGSDGEDGTNGVNGTNGSDGEDGNDGPSTIFRGAHSSSAIYYNNNYRRDVVLHIAIYYRYKGTDGASGAFSSGNWENFGAQFESVATNLLLAENANIGDWIFKNGQITSQNEKAKLYGPTGNIILEGDTVSGYDKNTRLTGDGVYVTGPGLRQFQPPTTFNANGEPVTATSIGPLATLGGKINGGGTASSPKAGVYGLSFSDDENNVGGLFTTLKTIGQAWFGGNIKFKTRRASGTITLTKIDFFISCISTSTVYFPYAAKVGETYMIKRATGNGITLNANGRTFYYKGVVGTTTSIANHGATMFVIYDGYYWQMNEMYN